MDEHHSQSGEAPREPPEAREVTGPVPLDLADMLPAAIWGELAEEAARYLELWTAWKNVPHQSNPAEEARLRQSLLDSVSHLHVHTHAMNETIEDALDLADQLDERGLLEVH